MQTANLATKPYLKMGVDSNPEMLCEENYLHIRLFQKMYISRKLVSWHCDKRYKGKLKKHRINAHPT